MRRLLTSSVLLALVFGMMPGTAQAATYTATAASTWIPNGQVWAMAATPSRIYLGGDFTSLKNPYTGAVVARNHVVAIDRATGNPSNTWKPSVVDAGSAGADTPTVAALNVGSDGTVYIGGDLKSIGGKARTFAGAVSSTGVVSEAFKPVIDERVWDFARAGNDLYMVGQFAEVNGQVRQGAAKISTTGVLNPAWEANLTGRAQAVAFSGSNVYIGGTLTAINGAGRNYLGSVNSTNGAVNAWFPANQCPAGECRVRDLAVGSSRVFAAFGGEPGGRVAAWNLGSNVQDPIWKDETDGDVQTVFTYDDVLYVGGHFDKNFDDDDGTRYTRNQFAAVNPANGDVLPYKLPITVASPIGLWAMYADTKGLYVGGGTSVTGKPFKNYLAFAKAGTTIPGPPAVTKVTVKTKGCKKCKVRLTENRGGGPAYTTAWKKAKKATTVFTVPISRMDGLTIQVDAPWEKKQKKTAEVVMRYKGQGVGDKVSPKEAKKAKKATSCYAGTTATSVTFTASVKKVKKGSKVGTRAYVKKTQRFDKPIRKAPKGVLTTKKPTKCS